MQCAFSDNTNLSPQVFDLLDVVFPGVRQVADHARALGAAWETVSTPFVRFEDGRIVSHVGVIELSLVSLGQPVTVGAIHGVATHPEFRRRIETREPVSNVVGIVNEKAIFCFNEGSNPLHYVRD